MAVFATHPSVRLKGTEDSYEPVLCAIPDCPKRLPHLHCPFCVKTDIFHDPVILKAHYRVKHVDKGIDFSGLKVLRCCDHCEIVGTIKGQKAFKGAHWHCYKCRNGFNRRDEALKHYKTHFRNPMTTFQIQVQQDINQMMYVPLQTEIVECPSALGADVSGGAIGCGDGSIFIQPWPNDQLLAHSNDGFIGVNGNTSQLYTAEHEALHQVGIAANETIGGAVGCGANGGDETRAASAGSSGGGGFYVMEQGQGDFVHCAGETITADMKTKTTEQWVQELEDVTTNGTVTSAAVDAGACGDAAVGRRVHQAGGFVASGDGASMLDEPSLAMTHQHHPASLTSQQQSEVIIASLRAEVKKLKQQLASRDERLAMMERRERDLLTQLRAATTASSLDVTGGGAGGSLPVSQILGDLKEKQEQLFLQYMGKLKAGGGRAAMGGVIVGSSMPSQVAGAVVVKQSSNGVAVTSARKSRAPPPPPSRGAYHQHRMMSMGDRDATTAAATSDCRARPGGVASVDDDDVNDDDADEDASSSHNDSQYSEESSRTLSNTSCQSEEPLPVGGGSSNSAVASATHSSVDALLPLTLPNPLSLTAAPAQPPHLPPISTLTSQQNHFVLAGGGAGASSAASGVIGVSSAEFPVGSLSAAHDHNHQLHQSQQQQHVTSATFMGPMTSMLNDSHDSLPPFLPSLPPPMPQLTSALPTPASSVDGVTKTVSLVDTLRCSPQIATAIRTPSSSPVKRIRIIYTTSPTTSSTAQQRAASKSSPYVAVASPAMMPMKLVKNLVTTSSSNTQSQMAPSSSSAASLDVANCGNDVTGIVTPRDAESLDVMNGPKLPPAGGVLVIKPHTPSTSPRVMTSPMQLTTRRTTTAVVSCNPDSVRTSTAAAGLSGAAPALSSVAVTPVSSSPIKAVTSADIITPERAAMAVTAHRDVITSGRAFTVAASNVSVTSSERATAGTADACGDVIIDYSNHGSTRSLASETGNIALQGRAQGRDVDTPCAVVDADDDVLGDYVITETTDSRDSSFSSADVSEHPAAAARVSISSVPSTASVQLQSSTKYSVPEVVSTSADTGSRVQASSAASSDRHDSAADANVAMTPSSSVVTDSFAVDDVATPSRRGRKRRASTTASPASSDADVAVATTPRGKRARRL